VREIRYRTIADDLRRRIGGGELAGGRVLPSEAELSASYAASRITVRRALDVLRDEGLVDSRQGFGWFVARDPLRQSLGRLGTIEAQLADAGMRAERRVLDFRFVPAPERAHQVLGARTVLEVRRLTLADGVPFARVTVWCTEAIGARLSRDDVERATFYEVIDVELGGATQSITADACSPEDAELLGVRGGSPVLRCERITRAVSSEPVLLSEHVFPAHRTELIVDLPISDRSIAPTGLRLVE
jgi:GntR family transcriptional regulator